jgi:hypothetical protein
MGSGSASQTKARSPADGLRAAIMAASPQGALPSEASGSGGAPQATAAAANSLNAQRGRTSSPDMRAAHAAGAACRALPWAAPWGWLTHEPRGGGAPCRPTAAQALQGAYVPPAQAGRRLPPPGRRVRAGAHHPRGTRHGVHHQQASALGGGAGSAAQRRRRRRVPGGGGGGRRAAEGAQPRRSSRGSRSAVRGHRRRP